MNPWPHPFVSAACKQTAGPAPAPCTARTSVPAQERSTTGQPDRAVLQHYQRYQPYPHYHGLQQQQRHLMFQSPVGSTAASTYHSSPTTAPAAQYCRSFQQPYDCTSVYQQQLQPSTSYSSNYSPRPHLPPYYQQYYQYHHHAAPQNYCFPGYQQQQGCDVLQTYHQEASNTEQLSNLDGVQSGVPTLTTPTLTPTTLRNIQQTFLAASNASALQPPEQHTNQAGFVPPLVQPQTGSTFIAIDNKNLLGGGTATVVESVSYGDHSSSNTGPPPLLPIAGIFTTSSGTSSFSSVSDTLPLSAPSASLPSSAPDCSTSPMPSLAPSLYSSDSDTMLSTDPVPGRRMGGRRPNNSEKLSEEEEHKRRVRRERNKMAAARCRKRRLDQTLTLQDQTEQLEEKKLALEREINLLTNQRDELEFLLATHKAVCTRASRTKANSLSMRTTRPATATTVSVSTALQQPPRPLDGGRRVGRDIECVHIKEENTSDCEEQYSTSLFRTIIPNSTTSQPTPLSIVSSTTTSMSATAPLQTGRPMRPTSLDVAPAAELGITIETPSACLRGFNFDSMLEGGTGLTPVTPLLGGNNLSTGLTPLTTPIISHPSASVASSSYAVTTTSSNGVQCTHQQRSSSSELSSPSSVQGKQLVSL